jgi:hypothetical protein
VIVAVQLGVGPGTNVRPAAANQAVVVHTLS